MIRSTAKVIREFIRPAPRDSALVAELEHLAGDPGDQLDATTADNLIEMWNNPNMVSDFEYLAEVSRRAADAAGPVLECGTGLTTFVAAIYSRHTVWSLEQHLPSLRRARAVARRAGLDVRIVRAPLDTYDAFDWYRVPEGIPDRFALVICDGPPGHTRGGRLGLLPVMHGRLASAVVLLDDAGRRGEQEAMDAWSSGYGVTKIDEGGRHAVLQVPAHNWV